MEKRKRQNRAKYAAKTMLLVDLCILLPPITTDHRNPEANHEGAVICSGTYLSMSLLFFCKLGQYIYRLTCKHANSDKAYKLSSSQAG